ncbi:transcription and mRNA export factor ENY2-like [Varroa destructor]|uniref:Transcription and mRNA export factor ENY2 n=1 Tax=Varroa destructor TaxID=109461 RepID=A0A7M7MAR9_VARDE|nr:transcription and mRNA export factor ENY2-like [Varroa destructor]
MTTELCERVKARLVESGQEELLKESLKTKLASCGWRDELKAEARKLIRDRGLTNVTIDELHAHLMPKARSTIPDQIKKEVFYELREFVRHSCNIHP